MGKDLSMKKTKLALFDLDGTLFDTDEVNYAAYRDALLPYSVELDKQYFTSFCSGRRYKEFLPLLLSGTEHMEDVHDAKKAAYRHNLSKAKMNAHLFQMIRFIKPEYYCVVVTTASRQNAMDILSHFNVVPLFDDVITQEDISRPKPDAQGFLLAMRRFGISAEDTVIFEDSVIGIQAARATGATVMIADQF